MSSPFARRLRGERRAVICAVICVGLPLVVMPGSLATEEIALAQNPPPNVLVLLTDDQRYSTIGALGYPDVRTPNLDRLVARGTAFTRAHIMGGRQPAVCAPSRAMFLTGRGLFALRDTGNTIPPEHEMFPETFRRAGYATFATGKWHNDRQAFARGFTSGGGIFFGGMHWPKEGGHEAPWLFPFDPEGRYPDSARAQARGFSSRVYADEAIRFLKQQATAREPFLAYVAFTSPHDPRTPPSTFARQYDRGRLRLPPNVQSNHPFDNGELAVRDEELLPRPLETAAVRGELASYYAMISEVDAEIGRILSTLEHVGLNDRTIVVFTSDNGLSLGSHGLLGKQNLYEESVRVPLIVAGPNIPRGARRNALCLLSDVFPTLVALAGIPAPLTAQGRSLVQTIASGEAPGRDEVIYAYRHFQRGLRTSDDWKLLEYVVGESRRTQLFNLSADPWELNDLSGDAASAERLTRMRARLRRAFEEAGDPLSKRADAASNR